MPTATSEPAEGRRLRVLMLTAELAPYAKTGGLADVLAALPKALVELGVDVRVAVPHYGFIDGEKAGLSTAVSDVPVPIGAAMRPATLEFTKAAGFTTYFVGNPHYFGSRERIYGYDDDGERFVFFCRAALEATRALGWRPDVVHCHDWHTGLVPNWLRTSLAGDAHFRSVATVFTIHNLEYQGHFGQPLLEAAGLGAEGFIPHPTDPHLSDVLVFMARGVLFADIVTTVSERYAQEILTPEFGERMDHLLRDRREDLFGIVNGIDTEVFDPATDPHLAARFSADDLAPRAVNKAALQERAGLPVRPDVPLIGMVTRLADHKGLDLLGAVLPHLLAREAQLVVLGTGDLQYHELLERASGEAPEKLAAFLAFDAPLAQQIYGGTDMFLMPSRHEPCGLGQLIAMRYGNVPIVRSVGGLADTVQDADTRAGTGTGFVFPHYDPIDFFGAISRALEAYQHPDRWRELMLRGMARDSSWVRSARRYAELFRLALDRKQARRVARAPVDDQTVH